MTFCSPSGLAQCEAPRWADPDKNLGLSCPNSQWWAAVFSWEGQATSTSHFLPNICLRTLIAGKSSRDIWVVRPHSGWKLCPQVQQAVNTGPQRPSPQLLHRAECLCQERQAEKPEASAPNQYCAYKAGISQREKLPLALWGKQCVNIEKSKPVENLDAFIGAKLMALPGSTLSSAPEKDSFSFFYTFGIEGTITRRWEKQGTGYRVPRK